MKEQIKTLVEARQEYPQLTATIRMAHAEPKPYNYTNEIDMINRIALGMSAKQFRELKGIPKGESIRPHLTKEQLTLIDQLQKADIGLLLAIPEFAERKKKLAEYAASRRLTG